MIEEELVAFLEADVAIAAVVADRVYPIELPENAVLPALVYRMDSSVREESHEGSGLARPRILVRSWGDSYGEAKTLARLVRLALNGFKGTMGATRVEKIKLENEVDDRQELTDRDSVIQDYIVWHEEA